MSGEEVAAFLAQEAPASVPVSSEGRGLPVQQLPVALSPVASERYVRDAGDSRSVTPMDEAGPRYSKALRTRAIWIRGVSVLGGASNEGRRAEQASKLRVMRQAVLGATVGLARFAAMSDFEPV